MRAWKFVMFALAVMIGSVQPLAAGPITYVESGLVSGTLGGATLTDTPFVWTFYGDTANVTGSAATDWSIVPTSNSITIGGSSGFLTTAVNILYTPINAWIGVCDIATCLDGIGFTGPGATSTYDLTSAISISETPGAVARGGSLDTTIGTLTITDVQSLQFTATVGTPEPETIGTLGAGLLVLAYLRRRAL